MVCCGAYTVVGGGGGGGGAGAAAGGVPTFGVLVAVNTGVAARAVTMGSGFGFCPLLGAEETLGSTVRDSCLVCCEDGDSNVLESLRWWPQMK